MRLHVLSGCLVILALLAGCSPDSLASIEPHEAQTAEHSQALIPADPLVCEDPFVFGPGEPDHFRTYQWHLGCWRQQPVAHVSALTAWDYTWGHALLGFLDGGIATYTQSSSGPQLGAVHPELVGALREHLSPSYGAALRAELNSFNYRGPFGHGIHTMGLAAARMDGTGTVGLCPRCSTILGNIGISSDAQGHLRGFVQAGAQAINLSLGLIGDAAVEARAALTLAQQRDVAVVAAAGNYPLSSGTVTAVQWPASDTGLGVIAVAGTNQSGQPWDERAQFGIEAASRFGPEVAISAPANSIYSTVYPGFGYAGTDSWPTQPPCGDPSPAGASSSDGYGLCSGTSMSTPIVTGIVGLIRSVNPLLPVASVRTALRTGATPVATPGFGAGIVNAQRAVEATLPRVRGVLVKNRLTPLFSLYSPIATDMMYTTVPQYASASILDQGRRQYSSSTPEAMSAPTPYSSRAGDPLVTGYASFPGVSGQAPTAAAFIFTSETNPLTQARDLVPLYRLSYVAPYGGNPNHRDHVYTTEQQGIQVYGSLGYVLDGIEGYIFPNTMAPPPGTVRLLRRYNVVRDDHAIFPETQLTAMQAEGYTDLSSNDWIGYVYPNVDSDGDGLIDGFELLLGTNPSQADSDCDGRSDGAEVPLAGLPVSDPLDGVCPLAASFVSQAVPSTVIAGQLFTVSLTMKNVGTTTWTQSQQFKLGSQNPQDNRTWNSGRVYLGDTEQVAPGQQKTFTFTATAPSTPGTYNFQWRMVQDVVAWFGDFSHNVSITVTPPPALAASFVSQVVPNTVSAGQLFTVSLTMKNIGTATWTQSQQFKLGSQNSEDSRTWGPGRVYLGDTEQVATGQQKTFTFTATAPSTPGTYNFQWRMVQDAVAWFGDFSPNVSITVIPPALAASFISQVVPSTVVAGQPFTVSLTMKNVGTATWTQSQQFKLGSQNPQDNRTWGPGRVFLGDTEQIATGQQKTFTFTATAPSTPGTYNFQWRMVQDVVAWFGDFSPNVSITVTPPS